MPYGVDRTIDDGRQPDSTLSVFVEQMKRHPLSRFRADAREALKCLDELIQEW